MLKSCSLEITLIEFFDHIWAAGLKSFPSLSSLILLNFIGWLKSKNLYHLKDGFKLLIVKARLINSFSLCQIIIAEKPKTARLPGSFKIRQKFQDFVQALKRFQTRVLTFCQNHILLYQLSIEEVKTVR